jgi:hypothetical protein
MNNILDLKEKKFIIKCAEFDDVVIMDENYMHLIKTISNHDEEEKLMTLRFFVKQRIKQLRK